MHSTIAADPARSAASPGPTVARLTSSLADYTAALARHRDSCAEFRLRVAQLSHQGAVHLRAATAHADALRTDVRTDRA